MKQMGIYLRQLSYVGILLGKRGDLLNEYDSLDLELLVGDQIVFLRFLILSFQALIIILLGSFHTLFGLNVIYNWIHQLAITYYFSGLQLQTNNYMGNSENPNQINSGVKEFIQEQFQRLKQDNQRDYLILAEVLQAKHPQDYPINFRHLGILYILDNTKDGIFKLQDFHSLTLWIQINLPGIQMYDFNAQLQARTIAQMIWDIQKKQSQIALAQWFLKMLAQNHKTKLIKEHLYIAIDSIKTIYEVFNVQLMSDMDIQSFFFLAKRSAEDLGFSIQQIIENDEEEEYIILKVCEQFILYFLKGIRKILMGIGYSSSELQIK